MTAEVVLDEAFALSRKHRIVLKVVRVQNKRFIGGYKVRFVMINVEEGYAELLLDNHEPYGFHMHTQLPRNKSVRLRLNVKDYNEALEIFFQYVERIIKNEIL